MGVAGVVFLVEVLMSGLKILDFLVGIGISMESVRFRLYIGGSIVSFVACLYQPFRILLSY